MTRCRSCHGVSPVEYAREPSRTEIGILETHTDKCIFDCLQLSFFIRLIPHVPERGDGGKLKLVKYEIETKVNFRSVRNIPTLPTSVYGPYSEKGRRVGVFVVKDLTRKRQGDLRGPPTSTSLLTMTPIEASLTYKRRRTL